MATFDLGRVTPLYKGDYSASASYELNDVVLYNGNLYWHIQATATVGILPTDTTVWKLAFSDEGVRAEIRGYADDAQASKTAAAQSASQASASASNASASASQAASSAQAASTKASEASTSAQTASSKASEATVSAQSAASSAQTATDKATLASQKAAAASESATLATAKANAAATSETNAAASAQTASAKATEAAASATSAQEYDESAQASAVNAQTAQGLAETAQTGAETAQGLAEDARDLAQQYAESIDPEHIFSAYPTDTASGAVASFADGADDIPLKSLVVDINPVQSGSGDPSPDNVRPISGWTEVDVEQRGKNLYSFDENKITTGNTTGGVVRSHYPLGVKGCILSFSAYQIDSSQTSDTYINVGKLKNGTLEIINTFITSNEVVNRTFTFSNDEEAVLIGTTASLLSLKNNLLKYRIQVEKNASVSEYSPYTGRSITIDLGQTVYGGKLDVLSGVLTVDRAMVDLGTLNWAKNVGDWQTFFSNDINNTVKKPSKVGDTNVGCSVYKTEISSISSEGDNYVYIIQGQVRIKDTAKKNLTAADFKIAMNGVQLVYELATPITIQLTPHDVKSLLGTNNVWADTGDSAVEYRADTKMYIERLTEPDADMIADANITSGSYFMVGNSLYLATSNIASGGQVIVGTNCTQKSLAQALNEINS